MTPHAPLRNEQQHAAATEAWLAELAAKGGANAKPFLEEAAKAIQTMLQYLWLGKL